MRRSSVLPAILATVVLALAVSASPVRAQDFGVPYVRSIRFLPSPPCDSIPTRLVIGGYFPTRCGRVMGHDGTTIFIHDPVPSCVERCVPDTVAWADTLDLGMLAAGNYQVAVTMGVIDFCDAPDETTYHSVQVAFFVGSQCPPNPPPPLDPMNYVTSLKITSTRDTTSTNVCEGDNILVRIGGVFPDDCHILRGIELLPMPVAVGPVGSVPPPSALAVRLVFDNSCCAGRVCVLVPTQFEGSVVIPPRSAGWQNLTLVGYETCCREEPVETDPVGYQIHGFSVASGESCGIVPPPELCLWPTWLHDQTEECDAYVTKTGDPAAITGMVHSTVALAGIQGEVHAYMPCPAGGPFDCVPLAVQSMEPIGLAAGMHLTWEPTAFGAKFVLFAEQGAPLPPTSPRRPSQFLRIRWAPAIRGLPDSTGIDPGMHWYVAWDDMFGSDVHGNLVPLCPLGTPGIFTDVADICVGQPSACDMNGDAHSDVRDLVLMSHCLVAPRNCPWNITDPDCDGDSDFDFDDLYCCAREVLGIPPCPSCGDSIRVESGIAVTFGTPQRREDMIEIPLRIDGMSRLGAAHLTLALPPGLAGSTVFDMQDPNWLAVSRPIGDRYEIGLVGVSGPDRPAYASREAVLRLTLPAGIEPSGEIRLTDADLSGPDGIKLKVDLGTPVVRLGAGVGASLSPARPNPFIGSTLFRLTLDAPADAEVGVFDLSGRRVATLHKGALAIGSHPFTWDGRVDGGSRVRSGVFFVRATVAGKTSMQKLVMLKQ